MPQSSRPFGKAGHLRAHHRHVPCCRKHSRRHYKTPSKQHVQTVEQIIAQIRPQNARFADELMTLVKQRRFDRLQKLVKQAETHRYTLRDNGELL